MKKLMVIIGLLSSFGAVIYLDSSTNSLTDELRTSIPFPYSPEEVEADTIEEVGAQTGDTKTPPLIPTLEWIFETQEEVDGYIVETYREYEIFSDESGNKIKQVPTSHFDYLKYKK